MNTPTDKLPIYNGLDKSIRQLLNEERRLIKEINKLRGIYAGEQGVCSVPEDPIKRMNYIGTLIDSVIDKRGELKKELAIRADQAIEERAKELQNRVDVLFGTSKP